MESFRFKSKYEGYYCRIVSKVYEIFVTVN